MNKVDLLILRHGPTAWNIDKRLQGHTDIEVDHAALKAQWPKSLPTEWHNRCWLNSPLLRAKQTAEHFQLNSSTDAGLIEMHWGAWEGKRISELREEQPQELQQAESQGLHLRPPGGESPFDVQQRLVRWVEQLAAVSSGTQRIGAVSHKGVIRALFAAATDWDMKGKPPVKLDFTCAQRFWWVI